MAIKIKRCLYVGLGGTGMNALLHTKKMFVETYGEVPPMIGFLGIDTDGDGKVDTETISTSFIGYAPYDNPKMSIVVLSPDIGDGNSETTSRINRRLSSQIVNKFFEIYG